MEDQNKEEKEKSRTWWSSPEIPASQEAKAGRLQIQGQPGQFRETEIQNQEQNKSYGYS